MDEKNLQSDQTTLPAENAGEQQILGSNEPNIDQAATSAIGAAEQ